MSRIKLAIATLLAAVMAVGGGSVGLLGMLTAEAGPTWCDEDPLVSVNGVVTNVTWGVQDTTISNYSAAIVVRVPVGATVSVGATLPNETVTVVTDSSLRTNGGKTEVVVSATVNRTSGPNDKTKTHLGVAGGQNNPVSNGFLGQELSVKLFVR